MAPRDHCNLEVRIRFTLQPESQNHLQLSLDSAMCALFHQEYLWTEFLGDSQVVKGVKVAFQDSFAAFCR